MSICELSDDEETIGGVPREIHTEKLLIENIKCDKCEFTALDEILLANHVKEFHKEPLPVFTCDECTFMTRTVINVK